MNYPTKKIKESIRKYLKTFKKLRIKFNREPTLEESAEELGIDKENIDQIIRTKETKRVIN